MKLTYYFVYLCLQVLIVMTILLGLLYIKKVRGVFFRLMNRLNLADAAPVKLLFWVAFLIIFLVLVDAATGYYREMDIHQRYKDKKVDNYKAIQSHQTEDYIKVYARLREFYMAERNFMLAASTLFVMYIFSRFLAAFKKLYDLEVDYAQNAGPSSQKSKAG